MPRVERLDRGDARLHHVVRGAAVALEGELHILGGDRLAVVELGAVAQREIVDQRVLGSRPGFREAGPHRLAGHRLHQRVMQGVHHHERGDDPRRLGRVEPGRRQRDVNAPGQLSLRRGGEPPGHAGGQGKPGEG